MTGVAGPATGSAAPRSEAGAALPLPHRVLWSRQESADTVSFRLEPVAETLPAFAPGQFAMVYAFGVGEIPVSVSGIAGPGVIHTVRGVGAVSEALCRLRAGDVVGLRGPFGTDWGLDRAAGHDLLILAGGIGLAPLRPLVQAVLDSPRRYGRAHLLIGARTPADLLYREELHRWRTAHPRVTVDRPDAHWSGHVGVVTGLLALADFAPHNTTAFVCGPEAMIRASANALIQGGVPAHRVRVSLERNMRCATGHCGHCQLGPLLLCRDGPVIGWDRAQPLLTVREL
ncbi:FAD/NAD(P)-binding protein [Streptomyces sp. ODS28]|uniref:FAD/NAD(P)-binding protein n=1 Tax=Streptomyces sp. ODS28 TaxID=3136688 RepID=UPI0031EDC691